MRQKRVHLRVERAGRSFAACSPQISITNVSRIVLHDAPAAVTCEGCRRSAEFKMRITGPATTKAGLEAWVERNHRALVKAASADVLSIETRERLDIKVQGDGGFGSIFILRGVSDAGRDWIEANCQEGEFNPFGFGARLVEHRFIADIVQGVRAAGLEVG